MARSSIPATCTAAWSRMLPAKIWILPVLKASTVTAWLSPLVGKNVTSSPSVRPMLGQRRPQIGTSPPASSVMPMVVPVICSAVHSVIGLSSGTTKPNCWP